MKKDMKTEMTRWFTPFRFAVPQQYEKWFETLAQEGWHPKKLMTINSLRMKFEKGEPTKYRYVVDYQRVLKKDYMQTYEDFGWEYFGKVSGMHVWRQEYKDIRPESFSDKESIDSRNKKITAFLIPLLTLFLLAMAALIVTHIIFFNQIDTERWIASTVEFIILVIISAYLIWTLRQFKKYKNRNN